jgi:sugar lactone lactonase YvrE
LWLITASGAILESTPPRCPPPWRSADGGEDTELREPRDIAVSPTGWFAVADTQNHRIRWYSEFGACLEQFGSEGTGPDGLREPSGLALAPDGSLAITDTWNGRVQVVYPDATFQSVGANLFGPRDALWTADGSLVVADTGNRRLLRFDAPDWRESLVTTFEGPVVGLASVLGFVAAAVPVEGALVLVDLASGDKVRRIEIPGWESREQQEAYLAVLPTGMLAASAPLTGEIWLVDPTGQTPVRMLMDGLPGVTGLALRPDGMLLASQTWKNRLVTIPTEAVSGQ